MDKMNLEGNFAMKNPLRLHPIIYNILSFLPVSTVKTVRLVSKLWGEEGLRQMNHRSVLNYKEDIWNVLDHHGNQPAQFQNLHWKTPEAWTKTWSKLGPEFYLCHEYCYPLYCKETNFDPSLADDDTKNANGFGSMANRVTRLVVSHQISVKELNQLLDHLPKISILELREGLPTSCYACNKFRWYTAQEELNTRCLRSAEPDDDADDDHRVLLERLEKKVKEIRLNYTVMGTLGRSRILAADPKLTRLQVRRLTFGSKDIDCSTWEVEQFINQLLTSARLTLTSTTLTNLSWKITRLTINLNYYFNEFLHEQKFLGHIRRFIESPLVTPFLQRSKIFGQVGMTVMNENGVSVDDPTFWMVPNPEKLKKLTHFSVKPEWKQIYQIERDGLTQCQYQNSVLTPIFVTALKLPSIRQLKVKYEWSSVRGFPDWDFPGVIGKWKLDVGKLTSLTVNCGFTVPNFLTVPWPNLREFEGQLVLQDKKVSDSVRGICMNLPKLQSLTLKLKYDKFYGDQGGQNCQTWDQLLTGHVKDEGQNSRGTGPSIAHLLELTSLKIFTTLPCYMKNYEINYLSDFFITNGLSHMTRVRSIRISGHEFTPAAMDGLKLALGEQVYLDFEDEPAPPPIC